MNFNYRVLKKYLIRGIGIILLIILLISVDFAQLMDNLGNIQPKYLLFASIWLVLIYFFKALRWKVLLKSVSLRYSFLKCLLVFASSNFIAFITPGRVGEIAKAFYLKEDQGVPFSKSFPTVIFDRLFDIYFLLAFSFYGIIKFALHGQFGIYTYLFLLIILLLPFILLFKPISLPLLRFIFSLKVFKSFQERFLLFSESFYGTVVKLVNPRLVIALILTLSAYLVLFYMGHLLLKSMGITIEFFTIAIFISVANVLSFIPVSVSGIGTREASLVFLFKLIDKPPEEAILFSFLLFFVFYAIGGIYGFIAYTIKPVRFKNLKAS